MEPSRREAHLEGCKEAARLGAEVFSAGGSTLDAVEAAVMQLESNPLYNAATGGCLTADGTLELDACVMVGEGLRAGAVAALPPFEHPIHIARLAMEDGEHVMYVAHGATRFAESQGQKRAQPGSMITPLALERLEKLKRGEVGKGWAGGTVGAVAVDAEGRVAAATSTGGTVGKRPGRVGDSPIVGAGTWADWRTGACSATGIGEDILRVGLARTACDAIARGLTAGASADWAVGEMESLIDGSGGVIVVDTQGRWGAARNTEMMSFAVASPAGLIEAGQ